MFLSFYILLFSKVPHGGARVTPLGLLHAENLLELLIELLLPFLNQPHHEACVLLGKEAGTLNTCWGLHFRHKLEMMAIHALTNILLHRDFGQIICPIPKVCALRTLFPTLNVLLVHTPEKIEDGLHFCRQSTPF